MASINLLDILQRLDLELLPARERVIQLEARRAQILELIAMANSEDPNDIHTIDSAPGLPDSADERAGTG